MSKNDKTFWATLLTLGVIIALWTQGCATYTVADGADPLVVHSEALAETFVTVSSDFLKFEHNNHAALVSCCPATVKAADDLRENGKAWHDDLVKATRAYKNNRTDGNKITLMQAKEWLDVVIRELRTRLAYGVTQ